MKKILLAVLIVGVVAAIAVSGTMAYYSTNATASSQVTTAKVALTLDNGTATSPIPLNITTGLVPGGTTSGDVTLYNSGNAGLYVYTQVAGDTTLNGNLTWGYALKSYTDGVSWQDSNQVLYIPTGGHVVLTITGTYADNGNQNGEAGAVVNATATFTGHTSDVW